MTPLIIILVIALLVILPVIFLIGQYNGLVKHRNRYRNGFAQIEVQLKRRYDLIPNLIETAKTYMKHERETLEAVISARNSAQSACAEASKNADGESVGKLVAAESALSGSMGRFFGLSESYPELRSNQNMMQLSEELTSTENKVAFSRQAYNDSVTSFNTKVESFPSNFIANFFSFRQATLFEVANEEERKAVKVDFN